MLHKLLEFSTPPPLTLHKFLRMEVFFTIRNVLIIKNYSPLCTARLLRLKQLSKEERPRGEFIYGT